MHRKEAIPTETPILNEFAEFLEKQDMLSKLTEHEKLHQYGYSEIHVIAAIGDLEAPNVTLLAQKLRLTKGAVSKITRRLISSGLIEAYHRDGNKQKVYFRLTSQGEVLYREHDRRHKRWIRRDAQFLRQFSEKQLRQVFDFMVSYNEYLEKQIQELGGKKDAD